LSRSSWQQEIAAEWAAITERRSKSLLSDLGECSIDSSNPQRKSERLQMQDANSIGVNGCREPSLMGCASAPYRNNDLD